MSGGTSAIMLAATAMSAIGGIAQGQQAKSAHNYNAQIAERNAVAARQQASADAAAQQRHARQVLGAARANYGASGVTLEGSPLDVLEMSAANAELDRQNILYKGSLRAMGYESDADMERMQGRSAQAAGYTRAASSVLTGTYKHYAYKSGTPGRTIAIDGEEDR
jgi:hypothetical protein